MADLTRIQAGIDALTTAQFDADYNHLSATVEAALSAFGYADAAQRLELLGHLTDQDSAATARAALTWATANREVAIVGAYEAKVEAETPIPVEAP